MHKLLILISLVLSHSTVAVAQDTICTNENSIKTLAVLSEGRVKPLVVAANETIKSITGKKSFNNESSVAVFCRLTLESIGIKSNLDLPIRVDHVDLKKLLNLNESEHTIVVSKAITFKELIRAEAMRIKQSTSYKKSLNRIWYKIETYEKTIAGTKWKTFKDNEWQDFPTAFTSDENLLKKLQTYNKTFLDNNENSIQAELTYTKWNIFSIAMIFAILTIFLTVLIKSTKIGYIFSWIVIAIEIVGMVFRVIISGRAPITNMYETVLFSGFGALLIALIIFIFKKDKIIILGGLGYNILCLFMMRFADGMLTESISPLVPVLRDNFWLSTHVSTIMLSYAALALSWLIANITLFKQRFGTITTKEYRYYEDLVYTATKVGIILLAAGIILGGVWADYSWGRFWGWDPKETWSLIVLLFYMAVLHGKNTSWITTHRFIILCSAGFMTVMMAWFGVNYILASGLHSYGFSEGGAIFLGTFFAVQIVLIIITGKNNTKKANV